MNDGLFNPEAFEQMPGQMSMAAVAENPTTWDGEPMYSPEAVRAARDQLTMRQEAREQWREASTEQEREAFYCLTDWERES